MAVQRIAGSRRLPSSLKGGVAAIGNFDGVHRGHQAVIAAARDRAAELNAPLLVLTFDPHPSRVFRPEVPHFVLTPPPAKARLLGLLGVEAVVEQPFTAAFAECSADDFVSEILARDLGARHVVAGHDFQFGRGREGTPAFLAAAGGRYGFGATFISSFCDEGAEKVSSSRIRALLEQGDVPQGAALLGYRYTVEAEVTGGQRLGRTLGYPTANMRLPRSMTLREGIYAVRFRRASGALHDGVASFGRRPTVTEAGERLLETFLFDFSGDLYGEVCQVSLFAYLRGEQKFDGLDALVAQMRRDEAEARALLAGVEPLSGLDAKVAFSAA